MQVVSMMQKGLCHYFRSLHYVKKLLCSNQNFHVEFLTDLYVSSIAQWEYKNFVDIRMVVHLFSAFYLSVSRKFSTCLAPKILDEIISYLEYILSRMKRCNVTISGCVAHGVNE